MIHDRQITFLRQSIDTLAREADRADREAERNYPGQDVSAARAYAATVRARISVVCTQLHRLERQREQGEERSAAAATEAAHCRVISGSSGGVTIFLDNGQWTTT